MREMTTQRKLRVLLAVCLVVILGYYGVRPLLFTPSYPDDFQIVFKYGVRTRNILNTSAGTYTKDLIRDPSVTIKLTLTEREMDTIWSLIQENEFYTIEEQSWGRSQSISPNYQYSLYVHAEGYPDRTLTMTELYYSHKPNEEAFFNITYTIKSIIENRPAYKKLPEPNGGYA